jgi:hypothetical protein
MDKLRTPLYLLISKPVIILLSETEHGTMISQVLRVGVSNGASYCQRK